MKAGLVILFIPVTLAFYHVAHSAPVGSDVTPCCFSYLPKPIPRKHVTDYFYTSGRCSQPAVVFVTRKKRNLCTNPDTKWVKEYVNFLEMKEAA
ncbi:C-C motif chemokine 5-like [Discoglossus pictus]